MAGQRRLVTLNKDGTFGIVNARDFLAQRVTTTQHEEARIMTDVDMGDGRRYVVAPRTMPGAPDIAGFGSFMGPSTYSSFIPAAPLMRLNKRGRLILPKRGPKFGPIAIRPPSDWSLSNKNIQQLTNRKGVTKNVFWARGKMIPMHFRKAAWRVVPATIQRMMGLMPQKERTYRQYYNRAQRLRALTGYGLPGVKRIGGTGRRAVRALML